MLSNWDVFTMARLEITGSSSNYLKIDIFRFSYCRSGNIREVLFSRISQGGQVCKFMNLAIFIIIIAPLKKKKNSRILNFVKNLKIRNLKHAKITRSTVFDYHKAIHFVSKFENLYRNIKF